MGFETRDGLRVRVRGVWVGVAKIEPATNPHPQDGFGLHRARSFLLQISHTVAIKSIRRSQVTGLLNLTKSHRGHTKNGKKSQNMVQKRQNFLQITIKISKYSNLTKP